MGFPTFSILAGVLETAARALTGVFPVQALGFAGVCTGSPMVWTMADVFLIPAYFHVKKVPERKIQSTVSS